MKIKVNNKEFEVQVAETDNEKEKGLQGVKELKDNEGMLFVFDEPQTVQFWMKDTLIPLDICFIDEDMEIISIYHGKPMDTTKVEEDNVLYVLEVSPSAKLKEGDEVELEECGADVPPMKVLLPNGESQMDLVGGERIFSRPNTLTIIKMSKRAELSKEDKDYKALGRKMFKFLKQQDERNPEYVNLPN